MGLTRKKAGALLAVALFLVSGNGLGAQSVAPSGQLGPEIQRLVQRLSQSGISSAERHDTQVRLARLLQLSGDIADAAGRWLEAAASDPGDDTALIAGAYCLAAVGEWERAISALGPLLSSDSSRGPSVFQARYLEACLRARVSGDASTLAALAQDPECASLRPLIYHSLWQIIAENPAVSTAGSAESWKTRLLAEFPQSPEARAANPERAASSVSAVQSPLWMLLPGTAGTAVARPAASAPAPAPGAAPAPASGSAVSPTVLQAGLFSREANARAQAEALRKAGFPASVSRKMVNNAEHWAVTVPAGQDVNRAIQELRRAGFDSFPIRN